MIVLIGRRPIFVAFDLGSLSSMTGVSGLLQRPQGFLLTPRLSYLYTLFSLYSLTFTFTFTFFYSLIFNIIFIIIININFFMFKSFNISITPALSFIYYIFAIITYIRTYIYNYIHIFSSYSLSYISNNFPSYIFYNFYTFIIFYSFSLIFTLSLNPFYTTNYF